MKAVCYIRVSTDRFEQEGSLENQKTLFIQFLKERGYEYSGIYTDVDSGTKELSRLARNGELAYKIKRISENNHIHLITLDGQVDTTDVAKQGMFGLYAWIYEQESARSSARIKSVLKSKMKEGYFLGSTPPYGYKITSNKSLALRNDMTVLIVKEIFDTFLNGKSYDKIARELTKRGVPTPASVIGKSNAGTIWHSSTIKLILCNPHYTGNIVQSREEVISATNKSRRSYLSSD